MISKQDMLDAYESYSKKLLMFDNIDSFKTDDKISKFINQNYKEILSNEKLLKDTHDKILSTEQMIKNIFIYDFLFYEPSEDEKVDTLENIINLAKNELAKFQGIVGGYDIEDEDWLFCTDRFKLKSNQIGLFNSCDRNLITNENHCWFLKNITTRIKKFISGDNIRVKYDMFDDEFNNIVWIVLIFSIKD